MNREEYVVLSKTWLQWMNENGQDPTRAYLAKIHALEALLRPARSPLATPAEAEPAKTLTRVGAIDEELVRAWMMSHGYGNQTVVYALIDLQSRIDAKDRELREVLARLPTPAAPVTTEPVATPDLSASSLLKLWDRANAAATDAMPALFQFAKLLLANVNHAPVTADPVVHDFAPLLGIHNDRDMLNYLTAAFDNEVNTCERCGHSEPTKNMDSASFLRDYLAAAPVPPQPAAQVLSIDTDDTLPPQEFIDYVTRNYSGDVVFHKPEWHAHRLWNAAIRTLKGGAA